MKSASEGHEQTTAQLLHVHKGTHSWVRGTRVRVTSSPSVAVWQSTKMRQLWATTTCYFSWFCSLGGLSCVWGGVPHLTVSSWGLGPRSLHPPPRGLSTWLAEAPQRVRGPGRLGVLTRWTLVSGEKGRNCQISERLDPKLARHCLCPFHWSAWVTRPDSRGRGRGMHLRMERNW